MTTLLKLSGEKDVRRWMTEHVTEYLDECNEVNCTHLAEAACQEFDAYGPAPDYACPEEYFDWAVDAEDEYFAIPPAEGH